MLATFTRRNFNRKTGRHASAGLKLVPLLAPFFLAIIILGAGCGTGEGIVAKVGSKKITSKQFKDELIQRYHSEEFAAQRTLEERKEVLNNMVEQKMRILDAYRLGLDQDSTVKKEADDTRLQASIQELYKVEIMDKVIPPNAAREDYDKMADEIKASHILIKAPMDTAAGQWAPAKAKIDSLYQLAISGAPFDTLARQFSEDVTTAPNGGDLGYFGWGRMVDEFQDSAFTLKVGQISHPVKSTYGYHIIKLIDRRPNASRKSFEEEEPNISQGLRRKYLKQLQKAAEDYLNALKEDNKLTYNYANIQKILDKVSDPSVPRNNDYFSNFSAEEKQWPVATMKGDTVTVKELQDEVAKAGSPPQWRDQKAITTMVERLVVPKLLGDRAKQKGLENAPSIREKITDQMESRMSQMVEQKQVHDKLKVDDAILLAYYQSHPDEFKTDSTVEVQEVYVTLDATKGKDLALAQNIAARAKRGEDFSKLVRKYTDRKSVVQRDGRIGPITSRQYGEMGKTAFRMNINEISDPIPMGGRAYSVIKLLDKTPPHVKTFEEAKSQVERQLSTQQSDSLRSAWTADLKKRYPATIYDKALMSVLPLKKAGAADTTATPPPGMKNKMRELPPDHIPKTQAKPQTEKK